MYQSVFDDDETGRLHYVWLKCKSDCSNLSSRARRIHYWIQVVVRKFRSHCAMPATGVTKLTAEEKQEMETASSEEIQAKALSIDQQIKELQRLSEGLAQWQAWAQWSVTAGGRVAHGFSRGPEDERGRSQFGDVRASLRASEHRGTGLFPFDPRAAG